MRERIWEALIQRIAQEERVNALARTVRGLCLYYAVFAAVAAMLSAVYPTDSWRIFSIVMTALASVLAVLQCANPFEARLRLIRREQAELEELHAEAGAQEADEAAVGRKLQLIIAAGAGVGAQERRAYERVKDRSEKWQAAWEGRPVRPRRLFGYEKFLFWLIEIAGIIGCTLAYLLPVAGTALAACGLL